jgi:hypothetical protein
MVWYKGRCGNLRLNDGKEPARWGGGSGNGYQTFRLLGISAATFVIMFVSALAGQWVRKLRIARSKASDDPNDRSQGQEEYLLGGSLALLALLLAFTFGLVLNRYEARRQLVTDEANAIGTAYLRAQLLDEPPRSRLTGLLIAYTDNRIRVANSGAEADANLAKNDQILTQMWASVSAAGGSAQAHGISMPLLEAFNESSTSTRSEKSLGDFVCRPVFSSCFLRT